MRLLIDTHALVWYVTNSRSLPDTVRHRMESPSSRCSVSMASMWEMSIKHSLGRLELGAPLADIFRIIGESGFDLVPISPAHVLHIATLPFHHQDPFDRLIIAQAIAEGMTVVTKDRMFAPYEVPLLWK